MGRNTVSRHIALIFTAPGRHFIEIRGGISEYAIENGLWNLDIWDDFDACIPAFKDWRPDGIILDLYKHEWLIELNMLDVPFVNIAERWHADVPLVNMDDHAVGRMAGEHLLERGIRHFLFVGYKGEMFSDDRCYGFQQVIHDRGSNVSCLTTAHEAHWQRHHEPAIIDALKNTAKPIGLMACHDRAALYVNKICRSLHLRVPDDVAVIGVDNDDQSTFTFPKITSIETGARRIGYEAANMLESIITGQSTPNDRIRIPPLHIVKRQSTDIIAVDDPLVGEAIRFIREHSDNPITVDDVLRNVPIARRTMERRFHELLGRSPHQEIQRMHMERARQLLIETDLQMPDVARRAGYPDAARFSTVFRKQTGTTPSQYRRRNNRRHN